MTTTEPRRFARRRTEPVTFYIDDDLFQGPPSIPAGLLLDLIELQKGLGGGLANSTADERDKLISDLFTPVLLPESLTLLKSRLRNTDNPLDLEELVDVSKYLLGEVYAARSFTPPPSSDQPPEENGTFSTDGAPAET